MAALNRARWRFDWPELLCVDCLSDPQAEANGPCPHVLTENPERQAR